MGAPMAARSSWRTVTLLVALALTADACGRSPDQASPGRSGPAAGTTSTAPARPEPAAVAPAGPPAPAELYALSLAGGVYRLQAAV
jgi:hypothetical protein